jgi:hypothetical protein
VKGETIIRLSGEAQNSSSGSLDIIISEGLLGEREVEQRNEVGHQIILRYSIYPLTSP